MSRRTSFVAAHHPGHRGVIPARGVISALGVNDRGVTHAGESLTPGSHSRRGVIHASDNGSTYWRFQIGPGA